MGPKLFRFGSEQRVVPADERQKHIPPIVEQMRNKEASMTNRGMFFDVYALDVPSGPEGKMKTYVIKDFRIGDALMTPEERVALFQHQFYEWNSFREEMGAAFFPETYWLRSSDFSSDQAHALYTKPGKTANTTAEFIRLRIDRQLTNRYGHEVADLSVPKKILRELGSRLATSERETVGLVVQEYVHGVSFGELIVHLSAQDKRRPEFQLLRHNIRRILTALLRHQDQSPLHAFSWDSLMSHNIMVETNVDGSVTGRLQIVDCNDLERPTEVHRDIVARRNAGIVSSIRNAFNL